MSHDVQNIISYEVDVLQQSSPTDPLSTNDRKAWMIARTQEAAGILATTIPM